jgi:iron(III) transport system ATP-binding protein
VKSGEFFTLLGPSGCGKSTTLRCVAGLEKPDRGVIEIAGRRVNDGKLYVPPDQRNIGMVFQQYAIWPHMTVGENVAFPLKQRKRSSKAEIDEKVDVALRAVRMEAYRDREAPYLSGGQQQRVALARAIVGRPDVLLLDEPLSNLDARLRMEMRDELRRICREIGITTLYVTHDQGEALALSDRIAVMSGGEIQQVGTPLDVYRHPASTIVASFVGASNFVHGVVRASDDGTVVLDSKIGVLTGKSSTPFLQGDEAILMIRPEAFRRSPEGRAQEGWNHLSGTVESTTFVGESIDCRIATAGEDLFARLPPFEDVVVGETIQLRFRPEWCWVLPSDQRAMPPPTAP